MLANWNWNYVLVPYLNLLSFNLEIVCLLL